MAWLFLVLAGICEIGWSLGFKFAHTYQKFALFWFVFSAFSMTASGVLLYLAQRQIPIGTAYMIWTGVGGVGTVLIGIIFFGDSTNLYRLIFLTMIIIGLVGLKLSHG